MSLYTLHTNASLYGTTSITIQAPALLTSEHFDGFSDLIATANFTHGMNLFNERVESDPFGCTEKQFYFLLLFQLLERASRTHGLCCARPRATLGTGVVFGAPADPTNPSGKFLRLLFWPWRTFHPG